MNHNFLKNNINLIVCLGNPGSKFTNTRHNVGFWFADELLKKYCIKSEYKSHFCGFMYDICINELRCRLLCPNTFMNMSGDSVAKCVNFYKLKCESILIIHDELDLIPGIIRLKKGGSSGGHNGIQDIINKINDNNFWRLRIGIGRPVLKNNIKNYVLEAPSEIDTKIICGSIMKAICKFPDIIKGNFEYVMTELHSY